MGHARGRHVVGCSTTGPEPGKTWHVAKFNEGFASETNRLSRSLLVQA